ncbi:hypothetical protein AVEN_4914-1 [Araneus ventricosus]|uniref:Uncharacterized protein n=1 Tax=Araneus ventricosus TaxID=182803 RepID=A0A4Y2N9L1_ARAVE|nr:hypothetical protein AVEN_4914-1 [Araneus ventricosus]
MHRKKSASKQKTDKHNLIKFEITFWKQNPYLLPTHALAQNAPWGCGRAPQPYYYFLLCPCIQGCPAKAEIKTPNAETIETRAGSVCVHICLWWNGVVAMYCQK